MGKHILDTGHDQEGRFERLYERHVSAVLAYARRRTDRDTADDVAAEVFAIAWRRINGIPEGSELPWLYATTRNVLGNEFRARQRRGKLVEDAEALARMRAAGGEAGEQSHAVLESLAELTPDEQEVLLLTVWEELDGRQAAAVLGCSATAYRIRLHRARRKLRSKLEERERPAPNVHMNPHAEEMF